MFCLTLEPNHYKFIKDLGYIPVGLGDKSFNNNWFNDKSGINISKKNRFSADFVPFCKSRKKTHSVELVVTVQNRKNETNEKGTEFRVKFASQGWCFSSR